jgi:hypothetical protein
MMDWRSGMQTICERGNYTECSHIFFISIRGSINVMRTEKRFIFRRTLVDEEQKKIEGKEHLDVAVPDRDKGARREKLCAGSL